MNMKRRPEKIFSVSPQGGQGVSSSISIDLSIFISIPPQDSRGVLPMPFTTVIQSGAHAGRLIETYFDKAVATSNTNAYVRYSDDGGVTWSSETHVNDDTVNAYHFHTAISQLSNGLKIAPHAF